jgi:hypothetical protein
VRYQNYQNEAVSNQLTGVGKGECVLGVTVNLMKCDIGGHHSRYTPYSLKVSLQNLATPKNIKYKYDVPYTSL